MECFILRPIEASRRPRMASNASKMSPRRPKHGVLPPPKTLPRPLSRRKLRQDVPVRPRNAKTLKKQRKSKGKQGKARKSKEKQRKAKETQRKCKEK